jgi:uroporphyrinogen decarboxylase
LELNILLGNNKELGRFLKLNSRERVRKALEHKEPDRVPIDLGAMCATGISAIAYNKLCKYLGIETKCRIYDTYQQLVIPDVELLERFHIDLKGIFPRSDKWREEKLSDGSISNVPDSFRPVTLPDGSKVHYEGNVVAARMPAKGFYFDHVYWPLKNATIEDLDNFNWPAPFSFYKLPDVNNLDIYLNGLESEAKYWYENSDFALVGNFGGSIFEAAMGLMGYERFLVDIIKDRAFVEKLLDKLVLANIEYGKRYLDKVNCYIELIVVGGEDLGTQHSLEISPELYREVIKPRQKKLWQFLRENSDATIAVHSCGAISEVIDDFIEIGVGALNPVQISAKGMDSKDLKIRFGDRITFWGGGCDTQNVLPRGSEKDIEEEVKKRINDFAPGGGFIFSQVQIIQADIDPERIITLFDTAYKRAKYPI